MQREGIGIARLQRTVDLVRVDLLRAEPHTVPACPHILLQQRRRLECALHMGRRGTRIPQRRRAAQQQQHHQYAGQTLHALSPSAMTKRTAKPSASKACSWITSA